MAFPNITARTTNFAQKFIRSRGPDIHPAFNVPSHFNPATSSFELNEVHNLREILEEVEKKAPELVDFDFDVKCCTWRDVHAELERAQDAVLASEQRGQKGVRKWWRAVGTYGGVVGPVLSVFPDELSVLHGGLALLLSIARHKETNRYRILRAVENLPNTIEMAQDVARNYPLNADKTESIRLHESINDLQQTLLRALPDLIQKLNPDTIVGKALGPFKGHDIDHILDAISSSSDKVRACAEGIRDSTITDIDRKVSEVLQLQQSMQYAIDAIAGQNGLLQFLTEYCKPPNQQPVTPSASPFPSPNQPTRTLTPSHLLSLVNVHHLRALDEQNHIMRRGSSLDGPSISRAASLIQTPQIQSLLHSPQSGLVLADGHADRAQMGRVSPVSYVCAMMAHAMQRQKNPVLVFFCGQHASSDDVDGLGGPQGLVRSLVSQLVLLLVQNGWMREGQEVPVGMSASVGADGMDWSGRGWEGQQGEEPGVTLGDLCEVLCWLLGLVPTGVSVFCLVDGISYYEREFWREDYAIVMGMFGKAMQDVRLGGFFKVLMTSPTASQGLPEGIPHERVSLRGPRPGVGASERALRSAMRTGEWAG
ncbi:hypothetical protein B0T14DRAFT_150650 [Immersiella caudata]|uniref:Uncharacterized protein n=1 Tax=Immersiella caudata TaxID=314043 RepID=A0AA40C353_9PEZI|nr:hypothetical protein B0T14DRAFT_150650 [Immersiella caudata]